MVPGFLLQEDEPQMLYHSMTVALLANSLNSYKGAPGNQSSIYGGVFFDRRFTNDFGLFA
jgi:hypothetical protein